MIFQDLENMVFRAVSVVVKLQVVDLESYYKWTFLHIFFHFFCQKCSTATLQNSFLYNNYFCKTTLNGCMFLSKNYCSNEPIPFFLHAIQQSATHILLNEKKPDWDNNFSSIKKVSAGPCHKQRLCVIGR